MLCVFNDLLCGAHCTVWGILCVSMARTVLCGSPASRGQYLL